MATYVHNQLVQYDQPLPKRPQQTPYTPAPAVYGRKAQEILEPDKKPFLDAKEKLRVQQVVGSFLYYAQAVDLIILASLSKVASQQAAPTENTVERVNRFLDYTESNPDVLVRLYASDMVLNYHSDTSYLTVTRGRSRTGGHFFLGSIPKDGCPIFLNGAILTNCTISKLVAASAAERGRCS